MSGRAKVFPSMPKKRSLRYALCLPLALAAVLCAQEPSLSTAETPAVPPTRTQQATPQRVTVQGQVIDARTGAGIERALVRIEGDAATGALTRSDGSFEIEGVPAGPQSFSIVKPGYGDLPFGGTSDEESSAASEFGRLFATGNHNIVVAPAMPALRFALLPTAMLQGRVLFSTGAPAPNVTVQLAGRVIEDGRQVWQLCGEYKTRSDGGFRLSGLSAGEYALFVAPFLESASATNDSDDNGETPAESEGYPAVYFPDARTPDGLAPIRLAPGEERQAMLALSEETFHRVTVPLANKPNELPSTVVLGSIEDAAGHPLGYPVRYSAAQNALEALLPEGSYRLLASTATRQREGGKQRGSQADSFAGEIAFDVAGKPLRTASLALGSQIPPPVEVSGGAARETGSSTLVVLAYPDTGWIDDGMASDFASGELGGPLTASSTTPGDYWLSPQLDRKNLCEASFAALGTSLANTPVHVGARGSTPPLTLALRSDCARLRLTLPASITSFVAGEEPFFTVYAVPDFAFTHSLRALTLRPTSGVSATLEGLTPGSYHVYLFAGTHQLAYRDRAALAKRKGQAVELAPGASAELLLEAPAQ